ncbi:E3 ubiquitin-protein ligase nrdp1-like protein [Plakobranchus ocellatus]|uniref:E3 ubiquitin-protein ligase nrdp1-like protein n=1 Tax=Plakobranchus ocellatus TaxID=259542 RepID=A0AAV4DAE0_9GAST|nr:E3 ubiquitin-protein ligase nrdp1-like protein [Plakobranchus ocellatus]
MGLDIDRFLCEVNEGLLCCICKDVLEEPLQAPCEHAFCRQCIQGWLINECTCPEDRQTLFLSDLRPLFRYMRNDLARLRLRCQYFDLGCQLVCTMDSLRSHESTCDHATVTCPHADCALTMTRRELEEHVLLCHVRRSGGPQDRPSANASSPSSEECPMGCGSLLLSSRDKESHNCIAELRTTIEVLRAELMCQVDDQRREMSARLDSQRAHMVQREAALKNQIEALKTEMGQLSEQLKRLMELEAGRGRELDRLTAERAELKAILNQIQQRQAEDGVCPNCSCSGKSRVTNV